MTHDLFTLNASASASASDRDTAEPNTLRYQAYLAPSQKLGPIALGINVQAG